MENQLLVRILKRETSLFSGDINENSKELNEAIGNSRILVIGAAGSIGGAFVKQLLNYSPSILHLVDISENNMVEIVRDIRSTQINIPDDFKTFTIDFGSISFERLIQFQKPYDYILNFSALKHVRSEKDPYTLMRMFNTNVLYTKNLLDIITAKKIKKVFSVSSDKATNPANIMGATKIFMERVLLAYSDKIHFSTARFANVAFSDGSLLYGFFKRLEKNQPFSAPLDVKRYFISHEEAGQLCLLSCFLGRNRDLYFPNLDKNKDLITFSEIAAIVLEYKGYKPDICSSENEAKEKATSISSDSTHWPCYFFKSDTTGEKSFEEFYTEKNEVDFSRYKQIGIIHQSEFKNHKELYEALDLFDKIKKSDQWQKTEMVKAIKIIVPELMHKEKNKNLDEKM